MATSAGTLSAEKVIAVEAAIAASWVSVKVSASKDGGYSEERMDGTSVGQMVGGKGVPGHRQLETEADPPVPLLHSQGGGLLQAARCWPCRHLEQVH